MDIISWRKVDSHDVRKEIEMRMELSVYQREKIIDCLDTLPYRFVEYKKPKKAPVLFRLTAPFYFIFVIIIHLYRPIKWIFTGNSYFEHDGKLVKFFTAWKEKMFL